MSLAYLDHSTASRGWPADAHRGATLDRLRKMLGNMTSSTVALPSWVTVLDTSRAGIPIDVPVSPSTPLQVTALEDVKRRSGFTWEQVARLFGVDRRSIHNWMNGQPMTQAHEDALHRLREIVHTVDDPNPLVVRARLRDRKQGLSIVDLVAGGRLDDARTVALGGVVADPRAALRAPSRPLSSEVRRQRSDALDPLDLAQSVERGERPQPALKRTSSLPSGRRHGNR